ncbi:hypothetical protein H6S82_10975 [Planktothrix sp. FACHB-1355]|uniref:Uncharacterized protein n=1 Tax=Aerosakkonema funiforme FACHB-1375 TaxID=2949571 RepID=A0A926VBR8_9CYAN|nr:MULTISPECIES: hypothetical protein [Oscillatoriales]MBD2180949.1 hypothetical protein [Aerosakkonema funiforme FACHB-1375]MBD3559385.1 hypothetical protein [Planktothrix sp. FACHB-1355]
MTPKSLLLSNQKDKQSFSEKTLGSVSLFSGLATLRFHSDRFIARIELAGIASVQFGALGLFLPYGNLTIESNALFCRFNK